MVSEQQSDTAISSQSLQESTVTSMLSADSKPMLRFLTCGSVDDGKSTLIGRLLYDTKLVFDDTLEALEQESKTFGTTGKELDFALLVDGLQAERAQGITIDVAYRYFATPKRKFIVADTPGHEQYTRNMVTGASHCDLAVILIDARKGVIKQTRRHMYIVHLLGIRHVVLAVNKMDLVDYDQKRFEEITATARAFLEDLGISNMGSIPISALKGANLTRRDETMPWYDGPTVLEYLETVDVDVSPVGEHLRMPIQWICRPDSEFRGYAGTLVSGHVRAGEEIKVVPGNQSAKVARIVCHGGDRDEAAAGDSVILTLDREIDIHRGDVICAPSSEPEVADQFTAHVVWMGDQPLLKGRPYILRLATQTAVAQVSDIKHSISMDSLQELASRKLELNDVAVCNFTTNKPLAIEPYSENRDLGGFLLVDRTTNATMCAGMIQYGLRRSHNIKWQELSISGAQRAVINGHKGCCIWFTGLSGSGKSTVANQLEKKLFELGAHTYILDGDNVRHGLNRDLGFTDADRVENIRRVAEVAKLMVDAGLITIVSFISPFKTERRYARELFKDDEFFEAFIDTPLEVCEGRDPKGLYRKARAGEIANFTGISSPYEPPENAECHLPGDRETPEALAQNVLSMLRQRGIVASG